MGLDGKTIVEKAEDTEGKALLDEDFALARRLGARGFPTIIMVNQANQGVKIVGGRPLAYYEAGLAQVLEEQPEPMEQPSLARLLQKEKLLFSKEIEVMYDLDEKEIDAFFTQELSPETFEKKEILGETYITIK